MPRKGFGLQISQQNIYKTIYRGGKVRRKKLNEIDKNKFKKLSKEKIENLLNSVKNKKNCLIKLESPFKKYSDEEFFKEYNKGYNDGEIARIFNVSSVSVRRRRLKFGLECNYISTNPLILRGKNIKEAHKKTKLYSNKIQRIFC